MGVILDSNDKTAAGHTKYFFSEFNKQTVA
jgi:hypothetical protein